MVGRGQGQVFGALSQVGLGLSVGGPSGRKRADGVMMMLQLCRVGKVALQLG